LIAFLNVTGLIDCLGGAHGLSLILTRQMLSIRPFLLWKFDTKAVKFGTQTAIQQLFIGFLIH
jgi:hypothetical protein